MSCFRRKLRRKNMCEPQANSIHIGPDLVVHVDIIAVEIMEQADSGGLPAPRVDFRGSACLDVERAAKQLGKVT